MQGVVRRGHNVTLRLLLGPQATPRHQTVVFIVDDTKVIVVSVAISAYQRG